MSALTIAAIVLACVFGGALAGMLLRALLPSHHLGDESKDIVRLATGVVATMAALVLGLLVSSAKSSFDRMGDELTQTAAKVVQIDRALRQYGPEAAQVRNRLRQSYRAVVDALVSQDPALITQLRSPAAGSGVADAVMGIRALAPRSDEQRELRASALALAEEVGASRWLMLLQQHRSISTPLLAVVVSWLTLIFVGFGMFSPPRNATVIVALFLCALSVSGAMLLILEMDDPLRGLVRISDEPMRKALAILSLD